MKIYHNDEQKNVAATLFQRVIANVHKKRNPKIRKQYAK